MHTFFVVPRKLWLTNCNTFFVKNNIEINLNLLSPKHLLVLHVSGVDHYCWRAVRDTGDISLDDLSLGAQFLFIKSLTPRLNGTARFLSLRFVAVFLQTSCQ